MRSAAAALLLYTEPVEEQQLSEGYREVSCSLLPSRRASFDEPRGSSTPFRTTETIDAVPPRRPPGRIPSDVIASARFLSRYRDSATHSRVGPQPSRTFFARSTPPDPRARGSRSSRPRCTSYKQVAQPQWSAEKPPSSSSRDPQP